MRLNPCRLFTVVFAVCGLGECVIGLAGWFNDLPHALATALFCTLAAACCHLLDPARLP